MPYSRVRFFPSAGERNYPLVSLVATILKDYLTLLGLHLQPHQVTGVNMILSWYCNSHGGIIADEMGLGKTCQVIAALHVLISRNEEARNLIIVPLSVVDHWETELKRFGLGKLRFVRYTGHSEERRKLRKDLEICEWNTLLTTYQYVIKDDSYFMDKLKFTALVFDEAHRLKSSESLLHQIVRKIKVDWTVLLTGTPVQNNLRELYSLLVLVDKRRFHLGEFDAFLMKRSREVYSSVLGKMREMLSAYLMRRVKEEVAIEIPASAEIILYHGMSDIQRSLYRAILCKNYYFFQQMEESKGSYSGSRTSLLNIMMELRKCVLHPYLFQGVEPEPFEEGEHLVKASEKLVLLDRILEFLNANGHRVLIFSQMTRLLDIVQDFLTYRGLSYERLDGSVRAQERYAALRRFQEREAKTFCFLLSTKAGGIGLNLTGADTVIFLDSDFNPQNDLQAAARCHRIGQKKQVFSYFLQPVKVIRLVGKNTVEEVIQYRATRKLRMTNQILGSKTLERESLSEVEISNMILFGLGQLNNSDAGDQEELSKDEDMKRIIGESKDGEWITKSTDDLLEVTDSECKGDEVLTDISGSSVENMYFFEGHDYRKDREVMDEIIAEGQALESRSGNGYCRFFVVFCSKTTIVSDGRRSRRVLLEKNRTVKQVTLQRAKDRAKKSAETLKKKREKQAMERKARAMQREERRRILWKNNSEIIFYRNAAVLNLKR
uniref:Helicase ATP-binding domain-containing protein n=1 Tax=Enterobius vermicularis TaxID=51028 RepID=A0A158Q9L0_ENTVE